MRLIDADKVNVVEYAGLVHIPPNDYLGLCAFFKKKLIDEQPTISLDACKAQWISVEDKFPEPMEWVLCFCRGNIVEVLRYDHITDDWDRTMPNRCYMKGFVTHWMPLPSPPEGA